MDNMLSLVQEEADFSVQGALAPFEFTIGTNTFYITEVIFVQLFVVLILGTLFFILGRNLKVKPDTKKQIIAEAIVGFFSNMVNDAMGKKYKNYTCYIAALLLMSMTSSLMGLLGLKAPTSDLSVIGAWGILTFILVQSNKFKSGGIKGYFISYFKPMPFMLPFNLLDLVTNPASQTIRHFANVLVGSVIMGLVYFFLSGLAHGLAAIGTPILLSLYFDIFAAVLQAYIFSTLTMIYVSLAECEN